MADVIVLDSTDLGSVPNMPFDSLGTSECSLSTETEFPEYVLQLSNPTIPPKGHPVFIQ